MTCIFNMLLYIIIGIHIVVLLFVMFCRFVFTTVCTSTVSVCSAPAYIFGCATNAPDHTSFWDQHAHLLFRQRGHRARKWQLRRGKLTKTHVSHVCHPLCTDRKMGPLVSINISGLILFISCCKVISGGRSNQILCHRVKKIVIFKILLQKNVWKYYQQDAFEVLY